MKIRLMIVLLFGFSAIISSQKKQKIKGNKMLIEVIKTIDHKFDTIEIDGGYSSCRFDLDIKADDVTFTLHRNSGGKINIKSENTTVVMNDRTDLMGDVSTGML